MEPAIDPAWRLVEPEHDGRHLERRFSFPDFARALAFVNRVGALAEEAQHHPDLELGWGRVVIKLRTHDEDRVGPKDYALAARIDTLGR